MNRESDAAAIGHSNTRKRGLVLKWMATLLVLAAIQCPASAGREHRRTGFFSASHRSSAKLRREKFSGGEMIQFDTYPMIVLATIWRCPQGQ
jgi:hypothetical protein